MKITVNHESDPNLQSILKKPDRWYKCVCGTICKREHLTKTRDGRYIHRCGGEAQDITDTEMGRAAAEW